MKMNTHELYAKETGDNIPDNQITYSEWYIRYVNWLEKNITNKKCFSKDDMILIVNALDRYYDTTCAIILNSTDENEIKKWEKIKKEYHELLNKIDEHVRKY